MNISFIHEAFLNHSEECLFDALSEFYNFFSELDNDERSLARRMDIVLHNVKDHISDMILILEMAYFLDLIGRAIDCENFTTKEQLFDIVFQGVKDFYVDINMPNSIRNKSCKNKLKKNWQNFSGIILYYAEKHLTAEYDQLHMFA